MTYFLSHCIPIHSVTSLFLRVPYPGFDAGHSALLHHRAAVCPPLFELQERFRLLVRVFQIGPRRVPLDDHELIVGLVGLAQLVYSIGWKGTTMSAMYRERSTENVSRCLQMQTHYSQLRVKGSCPLTCVASTLQRCLNSSIISGLSLTRMYRQKIPMACASDARCTLRLPENPSPSHSGLGTYSI